MTKLLAFFTLMTLLAACAPQAAPASSSEPFALSGEAVASVVYICDSGLELQATYYSNGAAVTYDGASYTLPQVVAGSGTRYQNETFQWWATGPEGSVANPVTGLTLDTCRESQASKG